MGSISGDPRALSDPYCFSREICGDNPVLFSEKPRGFLIFKSAVSQETIYPWGRFSLFWGPVKSCSLNVQMEVSQWTKWAPAVSLDHNCSSNPQKCPFCWERAHKSLRGVPWEKTMCWKPCGAHAWKPMFSHGECANSTHVCKRLEEPVILFHSAKVGCVKSNLGLI